MAMGGRQPVISSPVEVSLTPSLKSCLVNLPGSVVPLLVNAVAQNIVVELIPQGDKSKPPATKSPLFFGWTGFQSQTRPNALVNRDGIQGSRTRRQDQPAGYVELDAVTGRRLGIEAGSRATLNIHVNPPEAHTINIEPLTPDDWDMLNQHAEFLELNFLSQVRVIPNPGADSPSSQALILHLTATSTVAVKVVSIDPKPSSTQQVLKVASDAEVIVAPKTRQSQNRSGLKENRSVTSKRSTGARSTTSTTGRRGDDEVRKPIFLRPLDRSVNSDWIDSALPVDNDDGLKIWVDPSLLAAPPLSSAKLVAVSIVPTPGLEEPQSAQAATQDGDRPATTIIARIYPWHDAPDAAHVLLSSLLSCCLCASGIVGGLVRIDAAPEQLPRTNSIMKQLQADSAKTSTKEAVPKSLRITPFLEPSSSSSTLSFGGQTKAEQEKAVQRLMSLFGRADEDHSLFNGPLTHKMIIPADSSAKGSWPGGILRFEPIASTSATNTSQSAQWLIGGERKLPIEMQPGTARPSDMIRETAGAELPERPNGLVGVENILEQIQSSLLHAASIMLTGGLGSGKTSIASKVLHDLRSAHLYNVQYYPCRKLITDETRLSTIKDTLNRLFAKASWGARAGGRSLVVLDDLDKLCPVETELQVGNDNSRSRQVSELLNSIVKKHCTRTSGVVLLATSQGKESVNNVVVGGHTVRDIVSIKAPNKDGRRKLLAHLVQASKTTPKTPKVNGVLPMSPNHAWMQGSDGEQTPAMNGHASDEDESALDLLDIAGKTDGYHAGDLGLLVSRARSEALIRSVSQGIQSARVDLTDADFAAALKGFTPASLRNVTLQSSTTTFGSIGGLKETRQTLLETLQYPTTYAPIFAKCPLRLRSGLLLYGYPGCGKTMLASAVAGECGLNFISVKGPEILNKYIGASEKSVRDLFDRAEAARPCVLFFDEFDSIAPKRGHDSTGVTDRVVNQLLTQMDGAEGLSGVYVLAATSRPDLIDPALLRPGRLDKSLICDMPDLEDRLDILRAVSAKLKLDPSLTNGTGTGTLSDIARRTDGYSGADLQAIMYNAHLDAIHDVLGSDDLEAIGKKSTSTPTSALTRQFDIFRLSDPPVNGTPTTAQAAERAQIATRLAAMDLARRRAKEKRQVALTPETLKKSQTDEKTPTIIWRHVEKSLAETRPSLSAQERGRLARVYKEFVVGRSGDLKDGVQGTEIGGRTSLM